MEIVWKNKKPLLCDARGNIIVGEAGVVNNITIL